MGDERRAAPGPLAAVAVGHAMVTLPTLVVIATSAAIAVPVIGLVTPTHAFEFGVLAGCALGWACWSFLVPRWRDWVVDRGIDPDRVQRLAALTGLVWARGSFMERTEWPRRNGARGW
jgi:hypothetical protein